MVQGVASPSTGLRVDIGSTAARSTAPNAPMRRPSGSTMMGVPNSSSECFYYANVFGYAALEYHGSNDVFTFADVVEVNDGNRFARAGDDVFACVAYLNFVDQVAFCEYRAASCDVCGLFRGQRDFGELLYLYAKAMGLTGKEGARACRAQRVHSVIDRDAAIYADDFAVLTADF